MNRKKISDSIIGQLGLVMDDSDKLNIENKKLIDEVIKELEQIDIPIENLEVVFELEYERFYADEKHTKIKNICDDLITVVFVENSYFYE